MKDKELNEFSLTALFLVTGFCFFSFSKILQYLDGSHTPIFTWVGVFGILIGSLSGIRTSMEKSDR
jgi:predicted ABC-type exoprotein transport system permease subunit